MSVSLLVGLLPSWNYTDKRYLQFWIRYLSEFFWRHSWDVGTLVPNNSEFIVCLSVCYLAHFLTEITQILGYLQIWIRYLSEILWRHSWDVCTQVPNNSCMSVWLLVGLLSYWNYTNIGIFPVQDEISFWKFVETFLGCLYTGSK